MDPIKNPYAPGAGSRPPALTGREKEIESFRIMAERLIEGRSAKSVIVTGLRGVGKTVLLNTFRDIAEARGFKTGDTEVTHDVDFKSTMARLVRRALLAMHPIEKIKDKALIAARILKAFTIKTPEGYELGINVDAFRGKADSGNLSEDLSDIFIALGEAAKEKKSGVIFLLDEIQFLKRPDLEALIAATHQASQRGLPLTVVGAGLPQIPKLAGEAKSYAERLFDYPDIGRLDAKAAEAALEEPAGRLGVKYAHEATAAILKYTEGYPYFLQEYGKHVWNLAQGATITKADVESARPGVTAQLDENFFRVRIARTTPTEKNYVAAMAALGRGPYKTGDISEKLDKESSTLAPLRGKLINKGLIYGPSHGLTSFTVPQFDDFLRRNYPFEPGVKK